MLAKFHLTNWST